MSYRCSACHRVIGLMLDKNGHARSFFCPHAGRVAEMADFVGATTVIEEKSEEAYLEMLRRK